MTHLYETTTTVSMLQAIQPYIESIKALQLRNSKYSIADVLRMTFLACRDSKKAREEETVRVEALKGASSGSISGWKKKIVSRDAYTHMFKHTVVPTNTPRVIAVDGSMISNIYKCIIRRYETRR